MSYVPPHMRTKQSRETPKPSIATVEFPSLGNPKSSVGSKPEKSFSSLANDWANSEVIATEDTDIACKSPTKVVPRKLAKPLPKTEEVEAEPAKQVEENKDDGWNHVKRTKTKKAKPEKNFDEPDPEPEVEENMWEDEDADSYWKHP